MCNYVRKKSLIKYTCKMAGELRFELGMNRKNYIFSVLLFGSVCEWCAHNARHNVSMANNNNNNDAGIHISDDAEDLLHFALAQIRSRTFHAIATGCVFAVQFAKWSFEFALLFMISIWLADTNSRSERDRDGEGERSWEGEDERRETIAHYCCCFYFYGSLNFECV